VQLSCSPNSRKLPVDFSSIPAMSLSNKNNRNKAEKENFLQLKNQPQWEFSFNIKS
jgi:hypothetical protein